jgi:hypothetical protein
MDFLDGNFWRRQKNPVSGVPLQPSTGGEVRITGPGRADPYGCVLPVGSRGAGVVVQKPDGAVGRGIAPFDKDSPRDR